MHVAKSFCRVAVDILIDVDGVLADLVGGMCDAFEARGMPVPARIRQCLATPMLEDALPFAYRARVKEILSEPGFVSGLDWYTGARTFLRVLKEMRHNVIALTAPYAPSSTWMAERTEWLASVLAPKQIIFCPSSEKWRVGGDVLIEDRADIALQWKHTNPGGKAILINRPWNQEPTHGHLHRAESYASILEHVL